MNQQAMQMQALQQAHADRRTPVSYNDQSAGQLHMPNQQPFAAPTPVAPAAPTPRPRTEAAAPQPQVSAPTTAPTPPPPPPPPAAVAAKQIDMLTPLPSDPYLSGNEMKALPRDLLIAKAKAFREAQHATRPEAEQLSMAFQEEVEALKRSGEEVKSPFEPDNLDVPAYLRRQMENDRAP
jgi:hypothetical protein